MASNMMGKSVVTVAVAMLFIIISCESNKQKDIPVTDIDDTATGDSAIIIKDTVQHAESEGHSNSTFRNVKVKRLSVDSASVSGEAQVFEAVFGWAVEDGHNELSHGFTTASTGAPGWGSFNINIPAKKADPNTMLMLLIFENSAADDSRIHELAIPIPPDV